MGRNKVVGDETKRKGHEETVGGDSGNEPEENARRNAPNASLGAVAYSSHGSA